MELTERERRILAELERQLSTGAPGLRGGSRTIAPSRPGLRPHWTIVPAAVLGILLLAAGIALGVGSAVLLGIFLVLWWLDPLVLRLSRRAGGALREFFRDPAPPGNVQ